MNINTIIFGNIANNLKELQNRIYFFLFSILILRIGYFIPIPGVKLYNINYILNKYNNSFLYFLKLFSNGSLSYASIFMLGIMPYISSSIIIQLFTITIPYFINLNKDGIYGKYKINNYIKYLTLFLSIIQSILLSIFIFKINILYNKIIINKFIFLITSIFSLITSTMFLIWLGDQITDKGLGNGISIIIFINIISNLPNYILNFLRLYNFNILFLLKLFFIFIFIFFIVYFIVLVETSQRKILIQYAIKNYQKNRYSFLNPGNTYLPLKINLAGVMPSIFSSSIMILPSFFFMWLNNNNNLMIKKWFFYINIFYSKQLLYLIIYLLFIVFFCFFYTLLVFNPIEISDNLKKIGAYIPNIRPGVFTSNLIRKIVLRLTLFNSIYMCIVCLIPDFINEIMKISFFISGTSLLIVVVVIIELILQIQTLLISSKYLSILNKTYF